VDAGQVSSPSAGPDDQTPLHPSPAPLAEISLSEAEGGDQQSWGDWLISQGAYAAEVASNFDVANYGSQVVATGAAEVRGFVNAAGELINVGADVLRATEQVYFRNLAGFGGEVQYRSGLVTGYLAAVDKGPDEATSFQLNALADGASLGSKPLIEAGKRSWDQNDPTSFAEEAGAFAFNLIALEAGSGTRARGVTPKALTIEGAAIPDVTGQPRSRSGVFGTSFNDSGIDLASRTPANPTAYSTAYETQLDLNQA